jgi:16S rRNA (guanine527-N7)-methyltransferase
MPERSDREGALSVCPALGTILPELEIYETLLRKWQARINLVGPTTLARMWVRHFADSLQLLDFAPDALNWCDLGSGAGFPGLVVALGLKGRAGHVDLIESDQRKAAFLREVSRETKAPVEVHAARVQDVLPSLSPQIVTSRALADPAELLTLSTELFAKGARGLFLIGRNQWNRLTVGVANPSLSTHITASRTGDGYVLAVESRARN